MYFAMLLCIVPLLFILFSREKLSGSVNWFLVVGVVIFLAGHVWFMRKGHGHAQGGDTTEGNSDANTSPKGESESHNNSLTHTKK